MAQILIRVKATKNIALARKGGDMAAEQKAIDKRRTTLFRIIVFVANILTYGQSTGLNKWLGFKLHDGHLGMMGIVASIAGGRDMWVKCGI
eukprot:SAG31_NODE_43_length_31224_cov_10.112578_4_plen_91_part_00